MIFERKVFNLIDNLKQHPRKVAREVEEIWEKNKNCMVKVANFPNVQFSYNVMKSDQISKRIN